MVVAERMLTLDEFLKLPERKPALEFEEGKVIRKVSPQRLHAALQLALGECINGFARPRKLALAFSELRTAFGDRSYVPDLSVYRWARLPVDGSGRLINGIGDPPDIAIEIISPRQRVTPLVRRCLWYVANGVAVALLVDPDDESVIAFRAHQAPRALRGTDRIDLDDVLAGFELTVQELFAYLRLP